MDSTPPRVDPVGAGSCEAATLPEMSVKAGWLEECNPLVETALIHWCATAVYDSTPPTVEAVGSGICVRREQCALPSRLA